MEARTAVEKEEKGSTKRVRGFFVHLILASLSSFAPLKLR